MDGAYIIDKDEESIWRISLTFPSKSIKIQVQDSGKGEGIKCD